MKDPVKMGRHAEIVPMDGSHYVAECAAEYERRMDKWMSGSATGC